MTAWMIRDDSTAFGVRWHPYGSYDSADIEETLSAGEWLFANTAHASTRKLVIRLFASWAYGKLGTADGAAIREYLASLPYRVATPGFIDKISAELTEEAVEEPENLSRLVNAALNREFLRARYGGMYDTKPGNRDMYFRVSSVCFDWLPVIRSFVSERKETISTVTVMRDPESTGAVNCYLNIGNAEIDRINTADFLSLTGEETEIFYKCNSGEGD